MANNVFIELSIIILIAIGFAGLMRLLKQPLIIGYILTGIVVSPYFLNVFKSSQDIETFAQIGIALLLFMVGLNLNPQIIKEVGKVSIITGVGQVLFTSIVGYFIAKMLGFPTLTALYVSVAVTFSSTIIIMKVLSDKGDLDRLYARISIGFLIVQDLIAIFVLMFISSSANGMTISSLISETVLKGIGLLFLLLIIGMYILPAVVNRVAKSQEFLLLFSVGWCLLLATFLWYLNFSLEIGALLAGVTLSLSPYRYEISAKMKPLRDFFIILFFIILGSQMKFGNALYSITEIALFSLFILIGNPLIMMILMGALGYTKRTSFLVGLVVAQVSEFSFIMIALGVKIGHLAQDVLSFVTVIGMITITCSTYMIMYSDQLYAVLEPYLGIFEKKGTKIDAKRITKKKLYDIILFGYNKMGYDLLDSFKKLRKKFLIIDYDPETVLKLTKEGYDCRYGDAGDIELLEELNIGSTKMILSTISDVRINRILITKAREQNKKTAVIVLSHQIDDAMQLYKAGATYVIMPHIVSGNYTSSLLQKYGLDMNKFFKERTTHLKILRERHKRQNIRKIKELYKKYLNVRFRK